MINSCRLYTFSKGNRLADDYYYLCRNIDKFRQKLITAQNSNNPSMAQQTEKIQKKLDYLNKELPQKVKQAKREEIKIQEQMHANQSGVGQKLDILA